MRLRRSPREILDRSLQEARNVALWARPPKPGRFVPPPSPIPGWPDPPAGPGPPELVQEILNHRFPILGLTIDTGRDIAWRRDYLSGRETGLDYFRRVPYLDAAQAGDHKVIWELNRHQHLVVLAQSGEVDEVVRQIDSWIEANPFHRGINWASALEVAFRSLSWAWIYHLVGNRLHDRFRVRFFESLYQHGRHLENNLSVYFSPNTHLLGEALALHALGFAFPGFPGSGRWRELGRRVVQQEMGRQVQGDGSHFEQSTYYHVYALDMFRFHGQLEPTGRAYREKLDRMQQFLDAILGPAQRLPFFGDDDGGRLFHPYGPRNQFGRASPNYKPESRLFPDSGLAVIAAGPVHIVIDAGPFGPWSGGHSHSDTLSLIIRVGEEDILIDPGTYTYVGDPKERDYFRGSAAHNTIRIDGRDQAIPSGPFGWREKPEVKVIAWTGDSLEAQCSYGGFGHRRVVRLSSPGLLTIEDEVTGPPGEHRMEQFWHLGSDDAGSRFTLDPAAEVTRFSSWASAALGEKHPAPAMVASWTGLLPCRLVTRIRL